ncbi:hypothetical protein Angca_003569 [Angiostrongylus cantonensis]|nr:hypothetical protein Angca_003569 [Angiostrongylus cantonensis]
MSSSFYVVLGIALFLGTFGFYGLVVFFICIACFLCGFCYTIYYHGAEKSKQFTSGGLMRPRDFKFRPGISVFLKNRHRFDKNSMYEQIHSMTNFPAMDSVLEQMLNYVMRDYVDSWYKKLTDDELFKESLLRTARRSVASLSQCMRQVDWVPFVTRHVADDFASHLRLYRMASEKYKSMRKKATENDLLSHFFDYELEMEKTLCRDLLCTTPNYENAYLHDVVDIVLYLIMPPEDFRCRPLRFLLREVIGKFLFVIFAVMEVRRLIVPLLDHFSEPDEMNQIMIWLLSEISPRPDDFIVCLENSNSVDELEAIYKSVQNERQVLRGKDSGGDQGTFVKQQLGSLDYVDSLIRKKLVILTNNTVDSGGLDVVRALSSNEDGLVQLPLHVILTNAVAVSYFIDYLQTVGGQNYIDLYLAIEGFKVSVEHQLKTLSNGETVGDEVLETIKEAAQFMFQQYLSQEAITRVPLEEAVISKLLSRIRNDEPFDYWFEQIQEKVVEVLRTDDLFYPGFKKSSFYPKMLSELGINNDEDRQETPASDAGSVHSAISDREQQAPIEERMINDGKPVMSAVVETLGIGQQGKQSFALYNVRVSRSVNGKKYPKLTNLSFPGKKTFNNLDAHFLEKRTKALNLFLDCVLHPSMIEEYPELESILFDFLSQKEYQGNREPVAKKMMSAMFDPIKMGVKAVGSTVMAVPDQVYGGVSKVGAGINNAAKVIIQPLNGATKASIVDTDRVAAAITDDESTADNIPLRVLVLFVDEVFGVRARNAWFRRQLVRYVTLVTPFGTSINKRIVDLVHWLSSEQQVTMYLTAIRDAVWPDGQLAGEIPPRSPEIRARARILAKSLMLSALPDELRLILGAETTYTGISTISNSLQNKQLNRRLLYVLLERLLVTIFPNNRLDKIFARLHSKSPRSKKL